MTGKKKDAMNASNRIANTYLNFAETRAEKQWLANSKPSVHPSHTIARMRKHTSRTIIRATRLRRLPGVHRSSINQLVLLGSWHSKGMRDCSSWGRLRA